uniref:Uncharacterized protein n=1 Tax=Moniliophthora roreri TaxID=221103 RepID=A0A0W0F4M1_MONRR
MAVGNVIEKKHSGANSRDIIPAARPL